VSLRAILLHELTHLYRRDLIIKWLAALANRQLRNVAGDSVWRKFQRRRETRWRRRGT
jgi:Zn-dependent protease with chaperone function